jgi:hypothetical protein
MNMQKMLVASACVLLASCASQPPSASKPIISAASQTGSAEPRFGTLPPRTLVAGECAMFLWLRNAERKLVFFGAAEGTGRAVLDGKEVGMRRTGIEGREAFGQYEGQTYAYDAGRIQIQVSFERRGGMERGVVVPQGTLRLTQADGWEYILPVAGLVACEGT